MNGAAIRVAVSAAQGEVADLKSKLVTMQADRAAGNPLTQEQFEGLDANVETLGAALQQLEVMAAEDAPAADSETLGAPAE